MTFRRLLYRASALLGFPQGFGEGLGAVSVSDTVEHPGSAPTRSGFDVCYSAGKVILFSHRQLTLEPSQYGSTEGTSREFRDIVRSLSAQGFKDVILDLSGCRYIDSNGIAELVSAFTALRRLGGSIVLNQPRPKVLNLLRLTKLDTLFNCFNEDYSSLPRVRIFAEDLELLKALLGITSLDSWTLLMAYREGRIQLVPGSNLGWHRFRAADGSEKEFILASPYIIADKTRSYLRGEIEELEYLINSSETHEHLIQKFFESHPKFLLGQDYQNLHPQVLLSREEKGPLIPDFLLQPYDNHFCDILDLKLPSSPLIVGGRDRKRFSSAVAEAAAQLRTYGNYFEDPLHRDSILRAYGVTAYRPKLTVILGRTPCEDEVLYRQIKSGLNDINVLTYGDVIAKARHALLA